MTQSVKDEAKFLDTRLDDETAAVLEKWNLVILGAALLHDADHIRQAIRWRSGSSTWPCTFCLPWRSFC